MKQAEAYLIGGGVALLFHIAVGASLASVNPRALDFRPPPNVEIDVVEPPPPPPPEPPKEEPPPPEPPKPRVVMHRVNPKVPLPPTPPPPSAEPPKEPPKETAPPVFGVTLDSTVTGEANMAVPVGDTVGTNDRTPRKPVAAAPPSEGPPAFAPVSDSFVAQLPKVLEHDPREEVDRRGGLGIYPPEAKRLGIEGVVQLRVGIDRQGKVRSVRVIKKAGYGFDEAASQAMWRYKWSPAIGSDGRPVDFMITYNYKFQPDK